MNIYIQVFSDMRRACNITLSFKTLQYSVAQLRGRGGGYEWSCCSIYLLSIFYIYKCECLFVCLSVCLFSIDSKTTEPITVKNCTQEYLISVGKGGEFAVCVFINFKTVVNSYHHFNLIVKGFKPKGCSHDIVPSPIFFVFCNNRLENLHAFINMRQNSNVMTLDGIFGTFLSRDRKSTQNVNMTFSGFGKHSKMAQSRNHFEMKYGDFQFQKSI